MTKLIIREKNNVVREVRVVEGHSTEGALDRLPGVETYEGPWPEGTSNLTWDESTGTVVADEPKDKEEAYIEKDGEILQLNREANLKDFLYEGDLYVADKESIQGTQNQCLDMDNAELIPTFEGQWVLKDDTVRVFTVLEFKKFAKVFYMRASNNFKVKKYHQSNIKSMLMDSKFTARDMRDYDCTVGWV